MSERTRSFGPEERVTRENFDDDQDNDFDRVVEHYPDLSQGIWYDQNGDGLYERREIRNSSDAVVLIEEDGWSKGFAKKQ